MPYFQKLVSNIEERMALVVDPMLATGGSMIATIDLLKKAGCHSIKVLVLVAAPEGIAALEKAHPDVELYTASIDQCLNDKGYIVPGPAMRATRYLVPSKHFSRLNESAFYASSFKLQRCWLQAITPVTYLI